MSPTLDTVHIINGVRSIVPRALHSRASSVLRMQTRQHTGVVLYCLVREVEPNSLLMGCVDQQFW